MAHTLIYGGSFDPIHHGHLIACQRARELLAEGGRAAADRVLFVPARVSPHKIEARNGAGNDERLAMIHRAIAGNPYFLADGRELVREGPSYTFDTLASLRRDFPEERWTLLIGADQLAKFHTWHRVREMLAGEARVDIAILGRPGAVAEEGLRIVAEKLGAPAAETMRRGLLATPLIDISATGIRRRVAAGLPIDYLVPPPVAEYIREQGLYQTGGEM